jgi:hypothetical protein
LVRKREDDLMEIVSVRWTSPEQGVAEVETSEGTMSVPVGSNNLDWEKVQAWVDGGGIIQPYMQPLSPHTIAGAYFRAALTDLGHMTTVRAALTDPIDLELFNTASEFNDSAPDVNAVAAALSIDLAAVFDRAEAIRAARQTA